MKKDKDNMLVNEKNRIKYYVAAFLMFSVFAVIYYFLYPFYLRTNELKSEIYLVNEDNIRMNNLILRSDELQDEFLNLKREVGGLQREVPSEEDLREVIVELEKIFIDSEVDITGMRLGRIQKNHEDGYGKISIVLTAEGLSDNNDEELLAFVDLLERFPYLLVIETIELFSGEKERGFAAEDTEDDEEDEVRKGQLVSRINLNCVLFISL